MNELPNDMESDRRSSRRLSVDVDCHAVTDYDFFLLGDQIVDLSKDGLLLRSDGTPAEVGELVLVSFRPPESDHWIDAEAKVVRLVTGQTGGAPGIGLKLEPLPPFEQGLLAASLELFERERDPVPKVVPVRRTQRPDDVVEQRVLAVGSRGRPAAKGVARMVVVS